ncbi:DUF2510 domain-containing protein [Curtobacterium sp. MCBD17_040]|uniref:DUF2510 domain-containing protein n=1 Tax=Curtobacterium sp. MCBD17_040 TaxID=2175674 RepID=UPI000DAA0D1B|nr:DUF2510 domain-containing protein [Curtobacterium sp. MCBD17_040]WIB65768.1 DUF2510 domain-containing protein [Curtobacterium sp. MCBD17_040]
MDLEPGWYDDAEPWYVRYWDGAAWGRRQPRYPTAPDAQPTAPAPQPVQHAGAKAITATAVAALFALNDVAVLPIGYSPLNTTTWALLSGIALPVGTIAAVLLLLYVRTLHLEWATGIAISIGIVMVLSLPLGMLISSLLNPLWN